jgi:ABC-type branched-subunit amino acid transport system permease subunit
MALMYVLIRSPFGRSLEGIRERSAHADFGLQCLAINMRYHRGGFGGLAGMLWGAPAARQSKRWC